MRDRHEFSQTVFSTNETWHQPLLHLKYMSFVYHNIVWREKI